MTTLFPVQFESYLPIESPDKHAVLATFYERRLCEEPEELLMRAIFEDLINILSGGHGNVIQDGRHDQLYAEAVRDILSDEVYPFTFAFLCMHYGIDIGAARKALLSRKSRSVVKRLHFDTRNAKRNTDRRYKERKWARERRARAGQ